jgi:urea carboxylase
MAALADDQISVDSEIAGNLWQVHVRPGQSVAAGDVLLVIESMKMEIPVTAQCAGIIDEVHVTPGSPVKAGQRVVVMSRA